MWDFFILPIVIVTLYLQRVSLKYAMFLSKSSSSTLAVAMFLNESQYKITIDNSMDQSNL